MRPSLLWTFSLWVCPLLISCALNFQHVDLKAPAPDASAEERLEAYESLKPANSMTYTTGKPFTQFMQLGDGTMVYSPEDFLQVVSPTSKTATWVEQELIYMKRSKRWAIPAAIFFGMGGLGLGVSAATFQDNEPVSLGTGIVGGVSFLLTIAFLAPTLNNSQQGTFYREMAFSTYDTSLREALKLCKAGEALVDCKTPQSTSLPTSAPAQ